ncbi:WG repeat-containing protein [Clostridium vitabionis]|uniref:WG repeat-containing protein n=1 Tax=Clostridium vitabionis TaxID=2784388 RepID=UPI001889F0A7|nr:WG repeat-containing protein [Clostridium vitabionis]
MKKIRLLTVGALAAGILYAGADIAGSAYTEALTQRRNASRAADYYERGLYQLAYMAYQSAAAQNPKKEFFQGELASAKAFYQEEPNRGDMMLEKAYHSYLAAFPGDESIYEEFIQYDLDRGNSQEAADTVNQALANGLNSDFLEDTRKKLYYLFAPASDVYSWISGTAYEGYYRVLGSDGWGTMSTLGSEIITASKSYVGAVGEDGKAVCIDQLDDETGDAGETDSEGTRPQLVGKPGEAYLYGEDQIKYARFQEDIIEALGCGGGILPVKLSGEDTWTYLTDRDQVLADGLAQAGMFSSGYAFVQPEQGGTWRKMKTDGSLSAEEYEDVRLWENGCYGNADALILKNGGSWELCGSDGKPKSSLQAEDMDANYGQPVAYKKDGKWGFVNQDGSVYAEPRYTYEEVRSYSGGVAAVKQDGLWGFISPSGEMVIEPQFEKAGYFNSDGSCEVCYPGSAGDQLIHWAIGR